jgi:hypothetical protein
MRQSEGLIAGNELDTIIRPNETIKVLLAPRRSVTIPAGICTIACEATTEVARKAASALVREKSSLKRRRTGGMLMNTIPIAAQESKAKLTCMFIGAFDRSRVFLGSTIS